MFYRFKSAISLTAAFMALAATASAQNGDIIQSCTGENEYYQSQDSARSGQPGFYHQEFTLGEGSYTIAANSNKRFRFDAFFYERDNTHQEWEFKRQSNNVTAATHNMRAGSWGRQSLLQVVKSGTACSQCVVSVTIQSRSCPGSNSSHQPSTNSKACPVNQCYDDSSAIFGIGSCRPKSGWDGSNCP